MKWLRDGGVVLSLCDIGGFWLRRGDEKSVGGWWRWGCCLGAIWIGSGGEGIGKVELCVGGDELEGGLRTGLVGWYVEKGRGFNGWAVNAFGIFGIEDLHRSLRGERDRRQESGV